MLAYVERGSGTRPVLLLHGFLGSGKNLASLARRWAEINSALRFVLPDLAGHGASPPLGAEVDLARMANDVIALVDALGLADETLIVGHSLGARVGLAARDAAPGRFGALVLLDMGATEPPPDASGVGELVAALLAAPARAPDRGSMRAALTARGLPAPLADWLLQSLAPTPSGGVTWRIDRAGMATLHARFGADDLSGAIERARTPTLCVRGGRSPFVSDAEAARLTAARVEVVTLPAAGHYVHVDAQAELITLLDGFWRRSVG